MNKNNMDNPMLKKPCEYNYPGCLEVTDLQYIKKLGTVTLYKRWICDNCLAIINKK